MKDMGQKTEELGFRSCILHVFLNVLPLPKNAKEPCVQHKYEL